MVRRMLMMRSLPHPLWVNTPSGGRKMARMRETMPHKVKRIAIGEEEEREEEERKK